ncbi:MAG TPA: GNAT family N-acetyltransferase [Pyrinomonadaceae bacterium]|nr:GNAT family N-acetyltransferase [Pyrinomonadaceae bacterium]
MSEIILETDRLRLRRLAPADAPFISELVNEPSFLENIGDRNVRSEADAVRYIENGPMASYERHGFGLYKVELKQTAIPIGICGPLKRDTLEYPDIGFAFLPRFWGQGYALESASAVMDYAHGILGMTTIAAITTPTNERSIKLLHKLDFKFQSLTRLSEDEPPIKLFLSKPDGA